jgi:serine phosphatase RsbU (regulator of sigma subunit)
MVAAGQALDDADRLGALHRTGLLDSAPEPGFDRLTRLAARVLRAPISLVSLVDDHRQFFKSAEGLGDLRETPLSHSFCQHVVTTGKPLVVEDATSDPALVDNGAVTDLHVRGYAGVPLVTPSGAVIGSFCVIDTVPRTWSSDELDVLAELAGSVMTEIELGVALREARAAHARLALLAEASSLLATLNSSATLQGLARLAVRSLADWCSIALLGADGSTVTRVAVAHADPEREELVQRMQAVYEHDPTATGVVDDVIRTGQPQLRPVSDPELRELGLVHEMVVPLWARGRGLGAITFGAGPDRSYDEEDLRIAVDLARRAALALDNARAYETQREIAATLQRSLLPPALPDVGQFAVAATYKTPGDTVLVGGDFYDLFPLRGSGWGIAIGDVQGKGSGAASLTALARYTVRAGALTLRNPKQVLRTLNEAVLREDDDRFLTICLMTLSPAGAGLRGRVCLAGHPMPFLVRATGEVEQIGRPGTLLGVTQDVELSVVTFDLRPGDFVVLFTDGLLEARRDGQQFGNSGVREVLESCAGLAPGQVTAALEEAVTTFGRGEPRDDMAILVVGRPAV